MPLIHEFILIREEQILENDLNTFLEIRHQANNQIIASIHDDLINYMMDSIKWVPSRNPFNNEMIYGLFYHGISLIDSEGVKILNSITRAWIDLFLSAPDIINLTGSYFTIVGEPETPGQYEVLTFSKVDLLNQLNNLMTLIEKAMIEELKYQIVHFGI